MVKVFNKEEGLSIYDDKVDCEEESGDGKGRTEGCYIDNQVHLVVLCCNLARAKTLQHFMTHPQ